MEITTCKKHHSAPKRVLFSELVVSEASSLILQELNNDPAELRRFFQIHQMARVTDHHATGSRYTCLDGSCMRMHVRNVSVANKQKGWYVNRSQPRQRRLHRKFQFWMREVLRIGRENVSHSLLSSFIARRRQIFVFGGGCYGTLNVTLFKGFAQSVSALQEMFGIRHSADHCPHQHKLLHHFRMVQREVDRDFATVRAAHNRPAF